MSYKYSTGSVRRGDIYFEDDRTGAGTYIDFGQDAITLRPSGSQILHATATSIGIGTTSPTSLLHVEGDAILAGSQKVKAREVSATGTITTNDYCIRCVQMSSITLTLPSKTDNLGQFLIFKDALGRSGSQNKRITIAGYGTDKIDGSGTYDMAGDYEGLMLVCDGIDGWMIVSRVRP